MAVTLWNGSNRWAWLRTLVRLYSTGSVYSRVVCSSTSERSTTSRTIPFITASGRETRGFRLARGDSTVEISDTQQTVCTLQREMRIMHNVCEKWEFAVFWFKNLLIHQNTSVSRGWLNNYRIKNNFSTAKTSKWECMCHKLPVLWSSSW